MPDNTFSEVPWTPFPLPTWYPPKFLYPDVCKVSGIEGLPNRLPWRSDSRDVFEIFLTDAYRSRSKARDNPSRKCSDGFEQALRAPW